MTNDKVKEEIVSETKPETDSEQQPLLTQSDKPRVYNKKIPWWILTKILILTTLLFGLPIFTYFYTEKHFFQDDPIYAALSAVAAVNGVFILYLIVAAITDVTEDHSKSTEKENEKIEEKKN
ncbi:hypothetical protein BCR36DRAFT_585507, partial [Piromyces finnis]